MSRGKICGELFFTFCHLKINLTFGKEISAGFQSCVLNVQRNLSKERFFAKKIYLYFINCGLCAEKNYGIRQKLLGRVDKTAFYASSGMLKEKPVSEKMYISVHFRTLRDFFTLAKILGQCCQNEEHFEELIFFEKFLFSLSFSEIERKTFGLLSKTAQQGCKKCFPFLQTKTVFLNSSLSHLVQIVGKKFKLFVGKTLAVLSKFQSTYPKEHFQEKCFVMKKNMFFFTTVGVRLEIFGLFAKNFWQFF